MSRRSILLVTIVCVGLASIAAIGPVSAQGGGFRGAGSSQSAGPGGSHSRPIGPGVLVSKPAIPSRAFSAVVPNEASSTPNPPANSPIGPAPTVVKPTHTGPVGPGANVRKPLVTLQGCQGPGRGCWGR
jgi:hypothetical protein